MKVLKLMCCVLVLSFLLGIAAGAEAAGQDADPVLTVKGVGLGSSPAEIQKSLGKPAQQVTKTDDSDMGMGKLLELSYPGIKFDLCQPPDQKRFHVWRVVVDGSTWLVTPGLQVGMNRTDVVRLLGEPTSWQRDERTGDQTAHYVFKAFDGWYWVTFRGAKVVAIGATEDWS
jgi:hypothetical protein